jgi:hypothetical protein
MIPTNDDEWTPRHNIGLQSTMKVIIFRGFCFKWLFWTQIPHSSAVSEIENRGVLEDLIKESNFVNKRDGIIHFDSPDKRGIDVATISKKQYFRKTIPLIVYPKKQ